MMKRKVLKVLLPQDFFVNCSRKTKQFTMTNLNVYPETNIETWLPVTGYEKFYQVSSLGRVKRTNKKTPHRILKPFLNGSGYLVVSLSKGDVKKSHRIHKLVANHFIPKPQYEDQYEWQTNHKNGIKTDNRVANLEWCTPSENVLHAYSLGLIDIEAKRRQFRVSLEISLQNRAKKKLITNTINLCRPPNKSSNLLLRTNKPK